MRLSGRARLAGIVGWPVAHSLSPQIHNHWLAQFGIDGVFVPLPTRPEDFMTVIGGLHRAGFKGVSVTIPHKEAAFALAHRCNGAAAVAGAVNQLVFHDSGDIEGLNTDAGGLAASLRETGVSFAGKRAILLGAGWRRPGRGPGAGRTGNWRHPDSQSQSCPSAGLANELAPRRRLD